MRFRLVFHDTIQPNKYAADSQDTYELIGDKLAVFVIYHYLVNVLKKKHVCIYNVIGQLQKPELGIQGLSDFNF